METDGEDNVSMKDEAKKHNKPSADVQTEKYQVCNENQRSNSGNSQQEGHSQRAGGIPHMMWTASTTFIFKNVQLFRGDICAKFRICGTWRRRLAFVADSDVGKPATFTHFRQVFLPTDGDDKTTQNFKVKVLMKHRSVGHFVLNFLRSTCRSLVSGAQNHS